MRNTLTRDRCERAARIYSSSRAAAEAMACAPASFDRACARYGIATPSQRRRAERHAAQDEAAD